MSRWAGLHSGHFDGLLIFTPPFNSACHSLSAKPGGWDLHPELQGSGWSEVKQSPINQH